MARMIRYITHPQVEIDPKVDICKWGLNILGKARVDALAQSGALHGTRAIFSSTETKALETAAPLAEALGCEVHVDELLGENDRRATGFLPPDEFEATADLFFANPTQSVRGWETAQRAQARIVRVFNTCLKHAPEGDVLFVGHGAVGTLLWCHLSGHTIDRQYDQGAGGGGSYFEMCTAKDTPDFGWRAIETLFA